MFTEKGVSGETVVDNNKNYVFFFVLNLYGLHYVVCYCVSGQACSAHWSLNFLHVDSTIEDNLHKDQLLLEGPVCLKVCIRT